MKCHTTSNYISLRILFIVSGDIDAEPPGDATLGDATLGGATSGDATLGGALTSAHDAPRSDSTAAPNSSGTPMRGGKTLVVGDALTSGTKAPIFGVALVPVGSAPAVGDTPTDTDALPTAAVCAALVCDSADMHGDDVTASFGDCVCEASSLRSSATSWRCWPSCRITSRS